MSDYYKRVWELNKKKQAKQRTLLTGYFTSKYGDEFMLHLVCPLCGDQVTVYKKLNLEASKITVDFEQDVAGEMTDQLRHLLVGHYQKECGMDRKRRGQVATVLIDKHMDKVYD